MRTRIWRSICLFGLLGGSVHADVFDTSANGLNLTDFLTELIETEQVLDASPNLPTALKAGTKTKATKRTKTGYKAEAEAKRTQAKIEAKAKAVEQAKIESDTNGLNLTVFLTEMAETEDVADAAPGLPSMLKGGGEVKAVKQAKAGYKAEAEANAQAAEQAKIEFEAKVTEQAKLEAEAKSKDGDKTKTAEQAKIATEAKAAEQVKADQLEGKHEADVPEAPFSLQLEKQIPNPLPAKQADVRAPAAEQEKDLFIDDHFKVERSALGKERARLLAEINKSLTVELPPTEFLAQPDKGMMHVEKLSLFDATVLAIGYSNEVGASTAKRDTSEYLAAASLGPLLPHVDYRYSSGQADYNTTGVRSPSDVQHRTDRQVSVRQALVDLPSYSERQRQNLLLKSAEHSLSNTQERVAYETLVSFLKLIQLRLDVVLAKNYEAELKKLLEYMTVRAEAGGSTQADMQRVKGRVINTRSAGIEAQGAYESGLVEFRRLTGVMPSSVVIPESLLPVLPENFETAMATAAQNNYELQAALRDMESVVYERRAMQSKYAPKFDFELSATSTYNAGGVASSASNQTDDKRAMLTMSWNMFNGGADLMQAKALESKRLEQEYRAKEIQRKLEESLRNNFNALHAVSGRVNGVMQEMESNDLVLAAFNEQLFATNRSLLDVLDAYQRQYNSRTELTRLMIAEATAGLQMLRNMGRLQEGIMALR